MKCKLSLYADDSVLVYSGSDPLAVANFLSLELDTCRKWLIDNRPSFHLGKTECILFGPKCHLNKDVQFEVNLENTVVERVTCVKYLGMWLDQFIEFLKHVDTIVKKANFKLGFFLPKWWFYEFLCL